MNPVEAGYRVFNKLSPSENCISHCLEVARGNPAGSSSELFFTPILRFDIGKLTN